MIKNKCKKIISIVMIMLVMMATTLPVNVFANPSEFEGSCGGDIMYSFNEHTGELAIQGQGEMQDFSSLNPPPWYSSYKNRITSIKIEDGITYIGKCVFMDCRGLTSITIPDSVTEIGRMAFAGCTGLKSVILGNGVEKISDLAFWECTNLTSVTYLGKRNLSCSDAFSDCSQLKEVNVPSDYEGRFFCGIKVKKGDSNSPEVTESDNSCSSKAFEFESDSSAHMSDPESIYSPEYKGSCGSGIRYSFNKNTGELTICGVGDGMNNYLYWPYVSCVSPWYDYRNEIKSVTIDNMVMAIGDGAFYDCENLISVKMPPVIYIGNFAFSGCTSLTSINIPNYTLSIGESAFYGCENLRTVILPESIEFIGHHAFACCTNLQFVNFNGDTQPEIGRFRLRHPVFVDCPQLKEVKVPSSYKGNHFCGKKILK